MTEKVLSDFLKNWEEQLCITPAKGSKNRNIQSGNYNQTSKSIPQLNLLSIQQKMIRTVQKTPEVMIKISGGGKNMPRIRAHMDYISRHGQLKLEDQNGELYCGKKELKDIYTMWSKGRVGISETSEKRKEAFNMILSMPPGTDRQAVKDAARTFAQAQFKNHHYVFATHNDEKHPHVHLCVKAVNKHGVRLNPRKGDLQFWREQFAEKLRDYGIAANATPRRARGIVQKADKQVILHIDHAFQQGKRCDRSYIRQLQKQAIIQDIEKNEPPINPAQNKIDTARKELQKNYGQIARFLAQGNLEDQKLALDIVDFVKTMPPLLTKHETLVQDLSAEMNKINSTAFHNLSHKTLHQKAIGLEKIH